MYHPQALMTSPGGNDTVTSYFQDNDQTFCGVCMMFLLKKNRPFYRQSGASRHKDGRA